MSKKYLMGIDEGSQSAKITIFDLEGKIICEGKAPLRPYDLPKPGYVEHPDDDWWDAIRVACRNCMDNFTGNLKEGFQNMHTMLKTVLYIQKNQITKKRLSLRLFMPTMLLGGEL